ncbi:MAG: hypothetical protein ACE5R4_16325 [Armatimonadota bacterium]
MTEESSSVLGRPSEWPAAVKVYLATLMLLALLLVAYGGAMGLYFVHSDDFDLLERARLSHVHFNGHVYLFAIVGLPFALAAARKRWTLAAFPLLAAAIVAHAAALLLVEDNVTSGWVIGSASLLSALLALMAVIVLAALIRRKPV